jgi:hypothetical protein
VKIKLGQAMKAFDFYNEDDEDIEEMTQHDL